MLKKPTLVLFICAICSLAAKAQKGDTVAYFVKTRISATGSYDEIVNNKDSADYYRMVLPPDTGVNNNLLTVRDYYKNGKLRTMGNATAYLYQYRWQGNVINYFQNGKKKSIGSYDKDAPIGGLWKYYPNGKLYIAGSYDSRGKLVIDECRDSTGNVLAEKGNGNYKKYSEDFRRIWEEGNIVNGLEEGEWHGRVNDSVTDILTYDKGILVKGISYDEKGKVYPFTSREVEPGFKGGVQQFYKFLQHTMHYPAEAKERNIQGKVFTEFVVNEDGTLSDIKIVSGIGGGCDEEVLRVLRLSPPWIPEMLYGIPVRVPYTMPISFLLSGDL
ncbi:MAG: TonB family protein [Mucilaginibacter sp.]